MSQAIDSNTSIEPTNHPRVFRASPSFERGELEVAVDIADAIDDEWRVVITMGPYRSHNIHYDLKTEANIVHLDFYSVRPVGGYDLTKVISHIQSGIEQAETL